MLDGENLILIYEYILAKSAVKDLQAHIQLCFEFSTPFLKTTKYGYCLTTIQMAMTMLTEKSDLINIRKSEGDDDENEDDRMFATRRHSVTHSLQNVYKSSKEN